MIHFVLGQSVSAQWKTGVEWHDARVLGIRGPRGAKHVANREKRTSYRVQFSDGDVWDSVPHIKLDMPPPVGQ